MSPQHRSILLHLACGRSDRQIAKLLRLNEKSVADVVDFYQRKYGCDRVWLALEVLYMATPGERRWLTAWANKKRQKLLDAHVVDYTTARLAQLLATDEYWLADDQELGRAEWSKSRRRMSAAKPPRVWRDIISADMVAYHLGAWEKILGNRIAIRVMMRLAPIKPLFWRATDQHNL